MKTDVFALIEQGLKGPEIMAKLKADGATPKQLVDAAADYARSLAEDTLHRNKRAAWRGDSRTAQSQNVWREDAPNPIIISG